MRCVCKFVCVCVFVFFVFCICVYKKELKPGNDNSALFQSIISRRKVMLDDLSAYPLQPAIPIHRRISRTSVGRMSSVRRKSSVSRRHSLRQSISTMSLPGLLNTNINALSYIKLPFEDNDILQAEIEINPIGSIADSRITVKLAPVELIWNPEWITTMQDFVKFYDPFQYEINLAKHKQKLRDLRKKNHPGLYICTFFFIFFVCVFVFFFCEVSLTCVGLMQRSCVVLVFFQTVKNNKKNNKKIKFR